MSVQSSTTTPFQLAAFKPDFEKGKTQTNPPPSVFVEQVEKLAILGSELIERVNSTATSELNKRIYRNEIKRNISGSILSMLIMQKQGASPETIKNIAFEVHRGLISSVDNLTNIIKQNESTQDFSAFNREVAGAASATKHTFGTYPEVLSCLSQGLSQVKKHNPFLVTKGFIIQSANNISLQRDLTKKEVLNSVIEAVSSINKQQELDLHAIEIEAISLGINNGLQHCSIQAQEAQEPQPQTIEPPKQKDSSTKAFLDHWNKSGRTHR